MQDFINYFKNTITKISVTGKIITKILPRNVGENRINPGIRILSLSTANDLPGRQMSG